MAKGDKPSRVLRTKVKKAYRDVWYTIALGYPKLCRLLGEFYPETISNKVGRIV